MMKYSRAMLILFTFLFMMFICRGATGSSIVTKYCTTSPCSTCSPIMDNQICSQSCSADSCDMDCSAERSCIQKCTSNQGCNNLTCKSGSWCQFDLSQPTNAREMRCNAPICHMPCLNDNCTLLCEGPRQASCFPTCIGKGCIIKCNSYLCVANCTRGHCDVDFGPKSSGKLHCDGGHCKLTCQHGENPVSTIYRAPCKIMSCPNNTCTLKMIPKSDARITLVTSVAVLAGLLATLLFSQS